MYEIIQQIRNPRPELNNDRNIDWKMLHQFGKTHDTIGIYIMAHLLEHKLLILINNSSSR